MMFKKVFMAAIFGCLLVSSNVQAEVVTQTAGPITTQEKTAQQARQLFHDEKNAVSMLMPASFLSKGQQTPDKERIFQLNFSNLQLFINRVPIDEKGPKSAKFLDETLTDLQKHVAGVKVNGIKLVENKIIIINGRKALHVVENIAGRYKSPDFVSDSYTFFTANDMINIRFNIEAGFYEKFKAATLNDMVASITIGTKWKRFATPDNKYSYELPADVRNVGAAFDHEMLGMSDELMTGIMVQKIADNPKYSYYPQSLANLSAEEQAALDKKICEQLQAEVKTAKNIHNEFITVNNLPCIKSSFDDVTSHSIAYMFVQEGNLISFDYIFASKLSVKLTPVLERSVQSIKI